MQQKPLKSSKRENSKTKEALGMPKKLLATSVFGDTRRQVEIPSYKRDAVTLIANRFYKKMKEYFGIMLDFAAF